MKLEFPKYIEVLKRMVDDGILSNFVTIYQITSFENFVYKMILPMKKKHLNFISNPIDLDSLKMTGYIDDVTEEIFI